MGRRFGDLADDIAARLPDREGLVFGASRYTFREVAARIDEAARRLIAAGVGHGEHVALWLNNCDDWIFIAFAVQKIGAVLVPINTRFRSRDLAYVLAQSDSSFLITHDRSGPVDYAALVREAVDVAGGRRGRARPALPDAAARDPAGRLAASRNRRLGARSPGRRPGSRPMTWRRAPAPSIPPPRPSSCTPRARPAFPRAWCARTR